MTARRRVMEPEIVNTFTISYGKTGFWVSGTNTFPLRSQLRELGGTWNKFRSAWFFSEDKLSEIKKFLNEQDLSLDFRECEGGAYLVGPTYQHRDRIKMLGGRWNSKEKGWYFPDSLLDEVISEFFTEN